jgi:hypothetical protein
MIDFEEVCKKWSKQMMTRIGELFFNGFVCGQTSRPSPQSVMQVISRRCFDPGLVWILAELHAADQRLVAELTSAGSIRKPIGERARSTTRTRLVAHESMGLDASYKQDTPTEVLSPWALFAEPRLRSRGSGLSPVGRVRRSRHNLHRFHTGHPMPCADQDSRVATAQHQPPSWCGQDEGGETAVSWGHRAVFARGTK